MSLIRVPHHPWCPGYDKSGLCSCGADSFAKPTQSSTLPIAIHVGSEWHYVPDVNVAHFYPGDPIRAIEKASIRFFMEQHRDLLKGRVLDFGAGKHPYRDLVEGEYVAFEKGDVPDWQGNLFDAVIVNQVLHYLADPLRQVSRFQEWLKPGGHLVLTYQVNWPEIEVGDIQRFTSSGMTRILGVCGFAILDHQRRAELVIGNFRLALGYGVVARKV